MGVNSSNATFFVDRMKMNIMKIVQYHQIAQTLYLYTTHPEFYILNAGLCYLNSASVILSYFFMLYK